MPRRAANVTQADIARAIRALRDAGVHAVRIIYRPEGVSIEPADEKSLSPEQPAEKLAEERKPWIM